MEPSLAEYVLKQDLILHIILQNLSNVNELGTIQGLVSLRAVGILSNEALKDHLDRIEAVQLGFYYDVFEKPITPKEKPISDRDGSGPIESQGYLCQFMDPDASRTAMVRYIRNTHGASITSYPKGRVGLKKLKKKQDVLREYGFLTYIPRSLYARVRDAVTAQKLLRSGRSIDALERRGDFFSCFHAAFEYGLEVDLVKRLVPVVCTGRENLPQVALRSASRNGHVELVKYILDVTSVDINDPMDMCENCVLHFAAMGGSLDVVRLLVEEAHAVVTAKTDTGITPFMCAAQYGNIGVIKYLSECDCVDVHELDADGWNAVSLSIDSAVGRPNLQSQTIKVIRFLIEELHLDAEIEDDMGYSPVVMATRFGLMDILRYLVGTAKVSISNNGDKGIGLVRYAAEENDVSIIRYLVEEVGVDLNAPSGDGDASPQGLSVLTCAVVEGRLEATKYLVEKARVSVNGNCGKEGTVLTAACRNGDMDMIKYLVEQGKADVSAVDDNLNTCLHILAADLDRCDIAKYLVEVAGADVLQRNAECKNVLQVAAHFGSVSVAEYLISTGKFNALYSGEGLKQLCVVAASIKSVRLMNQFVGNGQTDSFDWSDRSSDYDDSSSSDYDDSSSSDDGYDYMIPDDFDPDEDFQSMSMMNDPEQFLFHDDSDDEWMVRQSIESNPEFQELVGALHTFMRLGVMMGSSDSHIDSSRGRRGGGNGNNSNNRGGRGRGGNTSHRGGRGGNTSHRGGRGRGGNNPGRRRGRAGSRGRGRGE